jgi:hypothetical protein
MRRVLILAALALCACTNNLDARIDKLEIEVAQLKDAKAQLFVNDEASRSSTSEFYANLAAVLQVDGIIESDNKTPAGRWWCNPATCSRAEVDCETSALALAKRGAEFTACRKQRIAWCRGDADFGACASTMELCLRVADGQRVAKTCIGVE